MKTLLLYFILTIFSIPVFPQPIFTVSDYNVNQDVLFLGGFINDQDEFVFSCDSGIFVYDGPNLLRQYHDAPASVFEGENSNILFTINGSQVYSISDTDSTFYAGDSIFTNLNRAEFPHGIRQLPDGRLLLITGSSWPFDIVLLDTNSSQSIYHNNVFVGNSLQNRLLKIDDYHYYMRKSFISFTNLYIDLVNDTVIEYNDSRIGNFAASAVYEMGNGMMAMVGFDSIYFTDGFNKISSLSKQVGSIKFNDGIGEDAAWSPITNDIYAVEEGKLFRIDTDTIIVYDSTNNIDLTNMGSNGIRGIDILNNGDIMIYAYNGQVRLFGTSILTDLEDEKIIGQRSITLYPNPFKDELIIKSDLLKPLNYTIYTTEGYILDSGTFKGISNENKLDFKSDIKSGLYLLKITDQNFQEKIFKIFKK